MSDSASQPPAQHAGRESAGDGDASRAAAADPLASLHRMSRTAGLGTQEYVAINPVAVTALLLGLASSLAIFSGVLLIIPVAGVICAVIALWQISDSNGTQTGRGFAWGGLVLALAFAGFVGTRQIISDWRTRSDRNSVIQTVETFGHKLSQSEFAAAYAMTGGSFRQRVPQAEFEDQLRKRYLHPLHGRVKSVRSNGLVNFEKDPESGLRFATTTAVIEVEKSNARDRPQMAFSKAGDNWMIEAFGWFPPRQTPLAQPAPN